MVATLMCLGLTSSPALAQQPAGEGVFPRCQLPEGDRERFLKMYGEGQLAFARQDLEPARALFEEAIKLCVDDEVLWFLGMVHDELGQPEVAKRYRSSWLIQRQLQGLGVSPPQHLASKAWENMPVKSLIVPGSMAPAQELGMRAGPGINRPHSLKLPQAAHPPGLAYQNIQMVDKLQLSPLPARIRPQKRERDAAGAHLSVTTTPTGALVYVDGVVVGRTPLVKLPLTAGRDMVLLLEKDGYHPLTREIYVAPGINQRLFLTMRLVD